MRTCSSVVAAESAPSRASAARTRADCIQSGADGADELCAVFCAGRGVTANRIAQSAPRRIQFPPAVVSMAIVSERCFKLPNPFRR